MSIPGGVLKELRDGLNRLERSSIYEQIVAPRDEVLGRFGPMFAPDAVARIDEHEFREFLLFRNNRHWSGLHRLGSRICADMDRLRTALTVLVDETRDLAVRLDEAVDTVPGMGRNIATAILLVTFPDRYGVWNRPSEAAMKQVGIWPDFERGESLGSRYLKVNTILREVAAQLDIDLWTVDALWWFLERETDDEHVEAAPLLDEEPLSEATFGLERHLHEFLRDNWSHISLSREWDIYREPGDEEAGYEYPCEVGRIDLLCRHRTEPRWLVIELKRWQTSDKTVGQILRYLGWVRSKLAEPGERVEGLIICHDAEPSLQYALSAVPDVRLMRYTIEFHLTEMSGTE